MILVRVVALIFYCPLDSWKPVHSTGLTQTRGFSLDRFFGLSRNVEPDPKGVSPEFFKDAMKNIMEHNDTRNKILKRQYLIMLEIAQSALDFHFGGAITPGPHRLIHYYHNAFQNFPHSKQAMEHIARDLVVTWTQFQHIYQDKFKQFQEICAEELKKYVNKCKDHYQDTRDQRVSGQQAAIAYHLGYSYTEMRKVINTVVQEMKLLKERLDGLNEFILEEQSMSGIMHVLKNYHDEYELLKWPPEENTSKEMDESKIRRIHIDESGHRRNLGIKGFDYINRIRRNFDQVFSSIVPGIMRSNADKQRDDNMVQRQLDIQIRNMIDGRDDILSSANLRSFDVELLVRVAEIGDEDQPCIVQTVQDFLKAMKTSWRSPNEREATFEEILKKYEAEYKERIDNKHFDFLDNMTDELQHWAYYSSWWQWFHQLSPEKKQEIWPGQGPQTRDAPIQADADLSQSPDS